MLNAKIKVELICKLITLTLKVSDINMGDDGINAVEGTIKYDTNHK